MNTPSCTATPTEFVGVVSTKQLCEHYPFLNQNTMRYLRHIGEGPACFAINGRVYYRLTEVDRWLAAQEAATTRGGAA